MMIHLYEKFEIQSHCFLNYQNWSYSNLFVCWCFWCFCNQSFLFKMFQRWSQNLSLNDLFIFFKAFKRYRKLMTQTEQSKITDWADSFDWTVLLDQAVSLDHYCRWAFISLNVNDFWLFSTFKLSSTSWQFSSSESWLSSLSWQSESSSLRCLQSDSLSSLSCFKYWRNELNISKNKAERSIAFSTAEIAACAKHQKEQQNWINAAQRLRNNKACKKTLW